MKRCAAVRRACAAAGLCLLALAAAAPAPAAPPAVSVAQGVGRINVSGMIEVWPDPPGQFDIETLFRGGYDAHFVRLDGQYINLGLRDAPALFRLRLRNAEGPADYVLELTNPRLQSVKCYAQLPNGGILESLCGTAHPVGRRDYFIPQPAFDLDAPAGEMRTFYFRVQHSGSLRFWAFVWERSAFARSTDGWRVLALVLSGALLLLACHSVFVFLILRESAFLHHALMTVSMFFCNLALSGLGPLLLWPDTPWWSKRAVSVFLMLTFSSALQFALAFLGTRKAAPRMAAAVHAIAWAGIAGVALCFNDWANRDYMTHAAGFVMPAVLVALSLEAFRRERRWALHFALTHSVVIAGLLCMTLLGFGLVPTGWISENLLVITFLAAGFLWSLGLTGRVRSLEQERRARLEREVADRTRALAVAEQSVEALSKLIPICSACKKIRDDAGYWKGVEQFIAEQTKTEFSHGICPACAHRLYPDIVGEDGVLREEHPATRD